MSSQVTAAEIYGDGTTRLIEGLWDACAEFMKRRSQLVTSEDRKSIKAAMPRSVSDRPDRQLMTGMAADLTMPRFLYLNQRQWEEAPPNLIEFVHLMGLQVLTSKDIPSDSGHLTRNEMNPHEIGKAIQRGQRLPGPGQ